MGASESKAKTSATGAQTKTFPEFIRDAPTGIETDWEKCPSAFLAAARAAFKSKRFPVYLWGAPGRGKTCAAACLFRSLKGEEHSCRWLSAATFLSLVTQCRREGTVLIPGATATVTEAHLWRTRVEQPQVLFVDDIGIRAPTDAQYEMLFRLIDGRGTRETVYTSNLSPELLQTTYDGRISSRLLRGTVIEFTGGDRRAETRKAVKV